MPLQTALEIWNWANGVLLDESVRVVPAGNLHVTLMFFGGVFAQERDALSELTKQVAWNPMAVMTGDVSMFGSSAIALRLLAEKDSLEPLIDQLTGTDPLGKMHGRLESTALPDLHVTIGRVRRKGRPDLAGLCMPAVEVSLDRFVLYESFIRPGGAHYEIIAQAR